MVCLSSVSLKLFSSWVPIAHTCHLNLRGRVKSEGSPFQASPDKKNLWDPISTEKKLGLVEDICNPSYSRKLKRGEFWSRPAWAKSEALSQKQREEKWLGAWLKWYSTYLASAKPRVQTPVLTKKKKRHSSFWDHVDHMLHFLLKVLAFLFTNHSSIWNLCLSVVYCKALILFSHLDNQLSQGSSLNHPSVLFWSVMWPWS
jgi:hypothetical protein